ncbi:autotransporter outer membrane beta-barrel domain-containing protein [Pontiellaceae bacterium B1224]|nr:autotransporter outer membrane beta-barrel domain-containing protein [Pontiellaceae bacterium B1224]
MKIHRIDGQTLLTISTLLTTCALSSQAQDLIYNSPTGSVTTITSPTNAARLFVGVDEANNHLHLENGALLSVSLLAEVGQQSSATNSLLSVENGGQMVVGNADTNNLPASGILVGDTSRTAEMKVDHDSRIITDNLYVGAGSNETGKVSAENGGSIEVTGDVVVGAIDSQNNVISLQDNGSLLIDNAANLQIVNDPAATEELNEVVVGSGSSLLIKGDLYAPDLINKDGLNFESGAALGVGGELTTVDNAINNGLNILLDDSLSTNHTAQWTASSIDVGTSTDSNSLTVKNGAQATSSGFVYVGKDSSATDNSIIITGSNSTFTAQEKVFIGANGSRNALEILEGASATIHADLKLGSSAGAANNTLEVDGTNSSLTVNADVFIGVSGANNAMTVSDGALATFSGDLDIGQKGNDNSVTVNNGELTTDTITVGSEGDSNDLIVTGTNGVLNAASVVIGDEGDSNTFKVSGGAQVEITDTLSIGNEGDSNYIQLNDSNSTVRAGSDVVLGANGDNNKIYIYGGTLEAGADVYVGYTNETEKSTVQISGTDAKLEVAKDLFIGSDVSSNNSVVVQNGGVLQVNGRTNLVFGTATNNTITIGNNGSLKTTDWDASIIESNLTFETGAGLWLTGEYTGTNSLEGSLNLTLDGTGASWVTTDMLVGIDTDNNSLTITNGASAHAMGNLTIGEASEGNSISVGGSGSLLQVDNNLSVGTEDNGPIYSLVENDVFVTAGASILVGGNAALYSGATLTVDSKSQMDVQGNYSQDRFSSLNIGISSNQTAPNLVVGGSADFTSSYNAEENSIIRIFNEGIGESNTIAIVQANEITLDGNKATGGAFEANIASNSLLGFTVTITNNVSDYFIVLSDFLERNIGEAGELNGQLLDVSIAIEDMATAGNSNATAMIDIISQLDSSRIQPVMDSYYGEKESALPVLNVFNLGIQNVANQVTMRADNTRSRNGMASSTADFDKPEGPSGPHESGQELQGWISAYGTKGSESATGGYQSYDVNMSGFMIGADAALNENWLLGFAGGSGSATTDEADGGEMDTKTIYASGYASLGTKEWFADMGFIYGNNKVDATLGTTFDTKADYSSQNVALFFGGGKEIAGSYLIFTPELSFLGNFYMQESYEEESSNAVGRQVDSMNTFNLQSTLGSSMAMYLGMGNVIFKPELRAYWVHDWMGDDETVNYSLIGGTSSYAMQLQAPEEDILKLGIGSSAKWGDYLEIRLDLDGRLGSDYRDYTLLGSLRYQF